MPRIKLILCSGIFCFYFTALSAQVTPKGKTINQVVGYQIHQQKQWNYEQLPKNSVLYTSDYRYSAYYGKKTTMPLLKIDRVAIPVINNKFSRSELTFKETSNSYIQRSHFLSNYFKKKNIFTWFDPHRPVSY